MHSIPEGGGEGLHSLPSSFFFYFVYLFFFFCGLHCGLDDTEEEDVPEPEERATGVVT